MSELIKSSEDEKSVFSQLFSQNFSMNFCTFNCYQNIELQKFFFPFPYLLAETIKQQINFYFHSFIFGRKIHMEHFDIPTKLIVKAERTSAKCQFLDL